VNPERSTTRTKIATSLRSISATRAA
jgi:hypothetical protein